MRFFIAGSGRLVRAMACSRLWSRSGLSRYITCSTGASKPVSSRSQTIRIFSGGRHLLRSSP